MNRREDLSDHRQAPDRRLADAAVFAYREWLDECERVRAAYARWSGAGAGDDPGVFAAYLSALDAEQLAADAFRDASRRLRETARSQT